MALALHLPIKLSLDPHLLEERGEAWLEDEVAAAAEAAVGRALARAEASVLAKRRGSRHLAAHEPTIAWRTTHGPSRTLAQAAPAALRAGIQRALLAHERAGRQRNAAEAGIEAPASERFDRSRSVAGVGYLVPVYHDGSDEPENRIVAYLSGQSAVEQRVLPGFLPVTWLWEGDEARLELAFCNLIFDYYSGRPPPSGATFGMLHGARAAGEVLPHITLFGIGSVNDEGFSVRKHVTFVIPNSIVVHHYDDESGVTPSSTSLRPYGLYALSRGRTLSGPNDFKRALIEHWQPQIDGAKANPPETIAGNSTRVEEYRRAWDAAAEQAAEQGLAIAFYPEGVVVRFGIGGSTYLMTGPRDIPEVSAIPVMVATSTMPTPESAEEAGAGTSDEEGAQGGTGGAGDRGRGIGGGGTGDGTGEGGDGTGEGTGGRQRPPPPPGIVHDPNAEPGDEDGRRYPMSDPEGDPFEIELGPFMGEPSVDELGRQGEALRNLMRRIAYRLEMPMGDYAGSFCIAAAKVLGARAGAVSHLATGDATATQPIEPGQGNLGVVDFEPVASPAIQFLQYLGATAPLISDLQTFIGSVLMEPENAALIEGMREGEGVGWALDHGGVFVRAMKEDVGWIFMVACQTVMLQLLRSSRRAIERRLDNLDAYMAFFGPMIANVLGGRGDEDSLGLDELESLKEQLNRVVMWLSTDAGEAGSASIRSAYASWKEARRALSDRLSDEILAEVEALEAEGTLVQKDDGSYVIKDRTGSEWTLAELDQAIGLRRGVGAGIDPLIQQLADIPTVIALFQVRPERGRDHIEALLREMLDANAEVERSAMGSPIYAFRASKIRESLTSPQMSGLGFDLQGVHLLAHQTIGRSFRGTDFYRLAIRRLFAVELGTKALLDFFEFTASIALAIVCPPLGLAFDAGMQQFRESRAEEQMLTRRAVLEPDAIISKADAELDLFMSDLEKGLIFIPAGGQIIRRSVGAGRTVVRQGVRAGSRTVARRLSREVLDQLAANLRRNLPAAFAQAVATDLVVQRVMDEVLQPVMEVLQQEASLGSSPPPSMQRRRAQPRTADEVLLEETLDPQVELDDGAPARPEQE